MVEIMKMMFLVACLLLHAESVEGYEFRLLSTNSQGTEGFVEIFYNGSWGLIGDPHFLFSDATASLLCRKLNLSLFGYGASYIHQETNTFRYFWLKTLKCDGNKRSIDECVKTDEFRRTIYIEDVGQWLRDYGSKLYCVDHRLIGGRTPNKGMLLAAFSSTQQSMCYQGFDSSAGDVVCKHLRYNGLVAFTDCDPGPIPLLNNKLTCTGNERSLNECTMSNAVIENCTRAVFITCKAVRLTSGNEYNNEGIVEIFSYGSWRYVRTCNDGFDDVTAKFLCKTLGFRNVGFTSRHSEVGRVMTGCLYCNGMEVDIMHCEGAFFFYFSHPDLNWNLESKASWENFWQAGWLYCFDTDQCQSNTCLNNGTCVDGYSSYTCNCTERWSGINCEIDLEYDKCQEQPCDNNSTCINSPAGYKCVCTEGYNGDNCTIDIDECLSQPCENNGACVNEINGYVCYCDQGYEGYRCQNEIGEDQTTLIVVLISSICVSSIVVLATVCCCLRYRKTHKKTKTDASNVLNSGKGGLQNSKEVEAVQTEIEEGHYNEDVYDEIKENTVADDADYIHPVTDVELPIDADGYVKFADNDQSVGYYKLKHTKTKDCSKLFVYKF